MDDYHQIKYNFDVAKLAILDVLIVNELRGNENNPFIVFQESTSEEDLLNDALLKKDVHVLECLFFRRFYLVSTGFIFAEYSVDSYPSFCTQIRNSTNVLLRSALRPSGEMILVMRRFWREK